jgi:hypothetical protein
MTPGFFCWRVYAAREMVARAEPFHARCPGHGAGVPTAATGCFGYVASWNDLRDLRLPLPANHRRSYD